MKEESLAPFGLVEVLDKFHVATVTTYMELENPESLCTSKVIIEQCMRQDINYIVVCNNYYGFP